MSESTNPPGNMEETSVERRRLALDERKAARRFELRKLELELKQKKQRAPIIAHPLLLASMVLAAALVINALVLFYAAFARRAMEQRQFDQKLATERAQIDGELVVEAIKTGDASLAQANLAFLLQSRLIEGSAELHNYLRTKPPSRGPTLPADQRSFQLSNAESIEKEVSRQIGALASDSRTEAAVRLLAIAARGNVERQVVMGKCLEALSPREESFATTHYAVLTLSRLDDGWCASESEHKRIADVIAAQPYAASETFQRAHAAAQATYRGGCPAAETAPAKATQQPARKPKQ